MGDLNHFTEQIRDFVHKDASLRKSVKFVTEEGVVHILHDQVHNEDQAADCTIHISLSNAIKLLKGELNAMTAFMMGKMKVEGEMGVAMKVVDMIS